MSNLSKRLAPSRNLLNAELWNDDVRLGRISELLIDTLTGRVVYALVSDHGGGIGLKPIPFSILLPQKGSRRFLIEIDARRFLESPCWSLEALTLSGDDQWMDKVQTFFQVRPLVPVRL